MNDWLISGCGFILHIGLGLYIVCWIMVCCCGCPCNEKYNDDSTLPDVFESSKLPTEACCLPSVGNGFLATVVYSDTIYVNGVYNGRGGASHRARVPSTAAIDIILPSDMSISKESYSLSVRNGTFHRTVTSENAIIEQRLYAHQNHSNLLINEITIIRTGPSQQPVILKLLNNTGTSSNDINFKESTTYQGTRLMCGDTKQTETSTSPAIHIAVNWTIIPDEIILSTDQSTKTWTFITAIASISQIASAAQAIGQNLASRGTLYKEHYETWQNKWSKGCIDVDNLTLSKAIYGSMYYILSSLPSIDYKDQEFPFYFYGLSPGGLAHGGYDKDYQGHVFWDQETWMYPTMLMFHPELGRAMLESRTYHIDAAKELAKSRGYKGAEYPWEMAYSGAEVCPASIYSLQEIHINGDISLAVQQYLHVTKDEDFLKNGRGYEMISELAKYWESRVEYNNVTGKFDIKGVKPPDEYQADVSNSVYTNAVAQISLRLPAYAGKFINVTAPSSWLKIADNLQFLYDSQRAYHPEFEGYRLGTKVKQADVILLGFPLDLKMDIDVRKNDLSIYEEVTDPAGPAMSWSMFSIGYKDIHIPDKQNEMFQRNFKNIQEPFKVWTEESSGSGAINFITGMGGFLQSVFFGYGGFRIHPDHLSFCFDLLQDTSKLQLTGVDYLGSEIDFLALAKTVSITVTSRQKGAPNLQLQTDEGGIKALVVGKTVTISRRGLTTIEAVV